MRHSGLTGSVSVGFPNKGKCAHRGKEGEGRKKLTLWTNRRSCRGRCRQRPRSNKSKDATSQDHVKSNGRRKERRISREGERLTSLPDKRGNWREI
jgi:hypothetical protein